MPNPARWDSSPVSRAARVGEHNGAVWKFVERTPRRRARRGAGWRSPSRSNRGRRTRGRRRASRRRSARPRAGSGAPATIPATRRTCGRRDRRSRDRCASRSVPRSRCVRRAAYQTSDPEGVHRDPQPTFGARGRGDECQRVAQHLDVARVQQRLQPGRRARRPEDVDVVELAEPRRSARDRVGRPRGPRPAHRTAGSRAPRVGVARPRRRRSGRRGAPLPAPRDRAAGSG